MMAPARAAMATPSPLLRPDWSSPNRDVRRRPLRAPRRAREGRRCRFGKRHRWARTTPCTRPLRTARSRALALGEHGDGRGLAHCNRRYRALMARPLSPFTYKCDWCHARLRGRGQPAFEVLVERHAVVQQIFDPRARLARRRPTPRPRRRCRPHSWYRPHDPQACRLRTARRRCRLEPKCWTRLRRSSPERRP